MPLNLSEVLSLPAFTQNFILRQRGVGSNNEYGEFVQTSPNIDLNVFGSIQPIAGRNRLDLPEGELVSEGIVAYIKNNIDVSAIRVGSSASNGDIIIFNDIQYLIKSVKNWQNNGHYKILATRIERQSG